LQVHDGRERPGEELALGPAAQLSNSNPSALQSNGAGPPAETPGSFASQVEWAARFLGVVDGLPAAALLYALLEFLGLRSGVDSYKDDADPATTSRRPCSGEDERLL
jgi:hypothetical protein